MIGAMVFLGLAALMPSFIIFKPLYERITGHELDPFQPGINALFLMFTGALYVPVLVGLDALGVIG
jgi:hypothetical protein